MQNRENKALQITTLESPHAEKLTPKYCTSIQVGLLNSGNLVLSLIYSERDQPNRLIERVVIDQEHADNLANVLKTAVTAAQEKKPAVLN